MGICADIQSQAQSLLNPAKADIRVVLSGICQRPQTQLSRRHKVGVMGVDDVSPRIRTAAAQDCALHPYNPRQNRSDLSCFRSPA